MAALGIVFLRFGNVVSRDVRALHTHERPEGHGRCRGDGRQIGITTQIPGFEVRRLQQHHPEQANCNQWNQFQYRGDQLYPTCLSNASYVDRDKKPDHRQRHRRGSKWFTRQFRDEGRQIPYQGNRNGCVTGHHGNPVPPTDQECGKIAEGGSCIGIGSAGATDLPRQTGKNQGDGQCACGREAPAVE